MLTGMDCSTSAAALGTDPLKPDTDGDKLLDREEVETHSTNPLDPDTDDDKLLDGDEIQTHKTDPRNPIWMAMHERTVMKSRAEAIHGTRIPMATVCETAMRSNWKSIQSR